VRTTPRGGTADSAPQISAANLPPIAATPAGADSITFGNGVLAVPE
jgi:hydroxybutyrate-dimer hydrolase